MFSPDESQQERGKADAVSRQCGVERPKLASKTRLNRVLSHPFGREHAAKQISD